MVDAGRRAHTTRNRTKNSTTKHGTTRQLAPILAGPIVAVLSACVALRVTARQAERAGGHRTTAVAALATAAPDGDQAPAAGDVRFAASRAASSTVKISGSRCGVGVDGSGFVVDSELVVTAAHVVRGTRLTTVLGDDGPHSATTVVFDGDRDIAVLRVTGLSAPPLRLAPSAAPGAPATLLGYAGGGDLDAQPAGLLTEARTVPREIGLAGTTPQPVWQVRGLVLAGDSGGPMVRSDGAVLGMVVARSTTTPMLGYAIGADHLAPVAAAGRNRTTPADTGPC